MKRNEVAKGIFIFIFGIMLLSLIYAQPTLVTPANAGSVSGASVSWNVTNGTLNEMTNCSIYMSSPSTDNSTTLNVSVGVNTTTSARNVTGTFDSTKLMDSNDYSIYASCVNATTTQNTSASTITINNTVPTVPSSLAPVSASTNTNGVVNFSATINGFKTNTCTLYFTNGPNPGSSSYTMTKVGNLCYDQLSGIPTQSYNYYILASDKSETAPSTTTLFNVHINSNSGADYLFQNQNNQGQTQTLTTATNGGGIPAWVIVLIVVVVILGIIISRKN
jgi:hypothetical protein